MTNWLAVSAMAFGLTFPASPLVQPPVPPPARVEVRDSVKDGMGKGALAGAAGMLAIWTAATKSCGNGCEVSSGSAGATALIALFGAGIGSVVGLAADLDAGPGDRPVLRAGPVFSHTGFRSSLVNGSAASPGVAVAIRLSPHLSVHVEYSSTIAACRGETCPRLNTRITKLTKATKKRHR